MGFFTNRGKDVYRAAEAGRYDQLQTVLMKCTPEHVNWQKSDGRTSLYVAARAGRRDIAIPLLLAGADVNLPLKNGYSPLFVAAENGHREVVKLLLSRGADADLAAETGATPLCISAQEGHRGIVKVLLQHGADINHTMQDGRTPLYMAAQYGHRDVARLLLDHGARVDCADRDGWTPLYIAVAQGHAHVVKLLLARGACAWHKAQDGSTPLVIACERGLDEVLRMLQYSAGARGAGAFAEEREEGAVAVQSGGRWLLDDSGTEGLWYQDREGRAGEEADDDDDGDDVDEVPGASWKPLLAAATYRDCASAPPAEQDPKLARQGSTEADEPDAPAWFVCPITQEVMMDPVIAADGHTYERHAIEKWLQHNDTSPLTNLLLPNKNVISNHSVRSAIMEWQEQGKCAFTCVDTERRHRLSRA